MTWVSFHCYSHTVYVHTGTSPGLQHLIVVCSCFVHMSQKARLGKCAGEGAGAGEGRAEGGNLEHVLCGIEIWQTLST